MLDSFLSFKIARSNREYHLRPVYSMNGSDLIIKGKQFYGAYNEKTKMWVTDEVALFRMIDDKMKDYAEEHFKDPRSSRYYWQGSEIIIDFINDSTSGELRRARTWLNDLPKELNKGDLDCRVTFADEEVTMKDLRSKRLSYTPANIPTPYYDKFMSTCFDEFNREKLEWAVGSILCGESTKLQKFIAIYGKPGTGKSTFLNILQMLFDGYSEIIDVDALVSKYNQFGTALLRSNPLVCIQHDADLSRIEKNDILNSIVSHEKLVINEKNVKQYTIKPNCMIFMGTNEFVNISDSRQGISRRMIDVYPTGITLPFDVYESVMRGIEFELSGIAYHCMEVYKTIQREDVNRYLKYRPEDMIKRTNVYQMFILDKIFELQDPINDPISVGDLYKMFKTWMQENGYQYVPIRSRFKENILEYYEECQERGRTMDGRQTRGLLKGFKAQYAEDKADWSIYTSSRNNAKEVPVSLPQNNKFKLTEWTSGTPNVFNDIFAEVPAQYSTVDGVPKKPWLECKTLLKDINTSREHYVWFEPMLGGREKTLIVIDFDLRGPDGEKSLERNLEAAETWPMTYCETSKSGKGLHLHYWYDGDPDKLSRLYSEGIEVKVFTGKASLRRKLKFCNTEDIATISSGLPLREVKDTVNFKAIMSEKQLRTFILRNLEKEFHGYTKPSIDFIKKGLDDAYESGLHYDVSDMQNAVLAFANNSSNNAAYCVKVVSKMKWKSDEPSESVVAGEGKPLTYFDVEVFPNVLIVCFKEEGEDKECHRLFNPSISAIETLFKTRLAGFNNRKYDNHILYARYMGYGNEDIYRLSQKLVSNDQKVQLAAGFSEAYNVSELDVYDLCSTKQSLKKWEIKLGIHHQENQYPWDEPLPFDKWEEVADYCCNDVRATEAVLMHNIADLQTREILAELSGLTLNHTTRQHITKIIFGDDKNPALVYTDLSKKFPGYKHIEAGFIDPSEFNGYDPLDKKTWKTTEHSVYLGEAPSDGGYVAYKPGIWYNVGLLDVESLHPHSIKELNLFGKYTKRYTDILDARLAIKHGEIDKAKTLFDGKLAKYLEDKDTTKKLAKALKLVINSVYGYTSATFANPFRDPRNVDNIVAKRGALFMIKLTKELDKKKIPWVHVKTDSIKIPNITDEIIEWVTSFGKKYGYTFSHEATYREMCLINGSTYVAKVEWAEDAEEIGTWSCVAAQFQQPYVKKTLFTKEPIEFEDLCEIKEVKSSMVLDYNEDLPEGEHKYQFVGRVGNFIPVKEGCGGGILLRDKAEQYTKDKEKYDKKYAEAMALEDQKERDKALKKLTEPDRYISVTGAKGFRWLDAESLKTYSLEQVKEMVDYGYYRNLCDDALAAINEYGDADQFIAYGNRSSEELAEEEFPLDDDALPF